MSQSVRVHPPPAPLSATLTPPGSKSLTNRAILLAAIADGTSTLRGCLDSEDTRVMLAAVARLGLAHTISADRTTVTLTGAAGPLRSLGDPERPLDVATAGTAARFLTAVLAASPLVSRVDGTPRMRERPMEGLLHALRDQGADIRGLGLTDESLPIEIHGAHLRGGEIRLPRPPSSQFISALILAAALAERPTRIILEQGTPARPYVDMTLDVLRKFGGSADCPAADEIHIVPVPLQARDYTVEPDASAASYLLALPAIHGGSVTVQLGRTSVQGDANFCEILARMGARVARTDTSTTVTGTQQLRGVDLDLTAMPDMTLTVAVLALHARGRTRVTGVDVLRHHESDRIAAAATELRKLGATVTELPDGLVIDPPPSPNRDIPIDTYLDHRMAMAFSLAGHVEIRDPACVGKTYPDFFAVLASLGMCSP